MLPFPDKKLPPPQEDIDYNHVAMIAEGKQNSPSRKRGKKTDATDEEEEEEEKDTPDYITEQGIKQSGQAVNQWMTKIKRWMQQFDSLEEMRDRLPELYEQLSSDKFADVILQNNLLSHLFGMGEVTDEDRE